MTETKAVIFDCFNVLCTPPIFSWYREHAEKKGIKDEGLLKFLEDFDLGTFDGDDVAKRLAGYEGRDPEEVRREIDALAVLDQRMVSYVRKLKESGYTIGLLSNGHAEFFRRVLFPQNPGFKELFDTVIISSDVKMIKPNHDIFEYALKDIGTHASEVIFVDDNQSNIASAIELGIQGVLFTTPDAMVEQFAQLGIQL